MVQCVKEGRRRTTRGKGRRERRRGKEGERRRRKKRKKKEEEERKREKEEYEDYVCEDKEYTFICRSLARFNLGGERGNDKEV